MCVLCEYNLGIYGIYIYILNVQQNYLRSYNFITCTVFVYTPVVILYSVSHDVFYEINLI